MAEIALISCVSQKRECRTRAEDMYTSILFKKSIKYIKNILRPDKIFILSAKYGLLPLDKEIDPYNVTLIGMCKQEKQKWAEMVMNQLKEICDTDNDKFYILAGKNYYQDLIIHLLNYEIIMEGLTIGKRFQWLNTQLLHGDKDNE
jgi:cytoplasmic iron level regulating protein YaaA (DUF328/UPF0246 family)